MTLYLNLASFFVGISSLFLNSTGFGANIEKVGICARINGQFDNVVCIEDPEPPAKDCSIENVWKACTTNGGLGACAIYQKDAGSDRAVRCMLYSEPTKECTARNAGSHCPISGEKSGICTYTDGGAAIDFSGFACFADPYLVTSCKPYTAGHRCIL